MKKQLNSISEEMRDLANRFPVTCRNLETLQRLNIVLLKIFILFLIVCVCTFNHLLCYFLKHGILIFTECLLGINYIYLQLGFITAS
jgi:hypothetical protein